MGRIRSWRASHAVHIWLPAAGWWLLAADCWLLAPRVLLTRGRAVSASRGQLLRLSIVGIEDIDILGGAGWRKILSTSAS